VRVVRGADGPGALPRGGVVTIGNYDGLHRGQRAVLESAVARARELGAAAVVLTFDPHPLSVLDPARAPRRLTSDRQREALLAASGVDLLWVVRFSLALAAVPAESFVREFLVERLGAAEVRVGSAFAFGRGREGDLGLLRRLGEELGFAALGIPERLEGAAAISSTRIRAALEAGEAEAAARLLGRWFALDGTVVAGEQLGRRIGWPTANLQRAQPGLLLPADGVYAARLRFWQEGTEAAGVANLGVRPTRGGGGERRVEIHLFDFERQIYGARVEIEFHRRLREERKFAGIEDLRAQIARDAAAAREYFASSPGSEKMSPPAPADGGLPTS